MTRRVTVDTRKWLPQYMIDEINSAASMLKAIDVAWKAAADGQVQDMQPDMAAESVMALANQLTTLGSDFDTMLQVAEKHVR